MMSPVFPDFLTPFFLQLNVKHFSSIFDPSSLMVMLKGGFKSEDVEGLSDLQTHMPNYYLKLLHPVTKS
jgi:hypothetical protein